MWEPGLGFWRREPLVAIGGLAAVGAEFTAALVDSGGHPGGSAGEAG
jgi:hypothetical protein